jgi:galactonate dehydratase
MQRRMFLQTLLAGAGGVALVGRLARAAVPKMKITRVRYYSPGRQAPAGVQSLLSTSNVICIDTDAGITGIGEGGTKDSLEHCASALIGQDPSRIETHWQNMFRGAFYPTGKEKLHALGGLDIALWDIKGKALGVPVYELLGGRTRDFCECYTIFPVKTTIREAAQECRAAGFRAFRVEVIGAGLPEGRTSSRGATDWNPHQAVLATFKACQEAREGVGQEGDWLLDCHGKLDMMDSITLANMVEPLRPFFVEDMVRPGLESLYRNIRQMTRVPIATADGGKFEIHEMIEQQLVDYVRVMIPNCGGITEYMKVASMCETHLAALSPHTTGPIATAAEVQVAAATTVPFLLQNSGPRTAPYLPQCLDFSKGRVSVNGRPGLGVEFDPKEATLITEVTKPGNLGGMLRPDGSYTNW